MSMLSGPEIGRQMSLGTIVIDPPPRTINPNSANLTLGRSLKVYAAQLRYREWVAGGGRHPLFVNADVVPDRLPGAARNTLRPIPPDCILDTRLDNPTVDVDIPPEGLVLVPDVLYLGVTGEFTRTRGFVPRLDGRSSTGRLGIAIHITASFGDNGFVGRWTYEIMVASPVRVYAGMEIAQISYTTIVGDETYYDGRYQGDETVVPSRMHLGRP